MAFYNAIAAFVINTNTNHILESCSEFVNVKSNRSAKIEVESAVWCHDNSTLRICLRYVHAELCKIPAMSMIYLYFEDEMQVPICCYASQDACKATAELAMKIQEQIVAVYQNRAGEVSLSKVLHVVKQQAQENARPEYTKEDNWKMIRDAVMENPIGCDVLMNLFYISLFAKKRTQVLNPIPVELDSICGQDERCLLLEKWVHALPSLEEVKMGLSCISDEGLYLLNWLFVRRPIRLVQKKVDLDQFKGQKLLKPSYCFQVDHSDDPIFAHLETMHGTHRGYHGTSTENLHSILHRGLKNRSFTKHMSTGAVFGEGVYLAEDLSVAQHFVAPSAIIWPKSMLHQGNARVGLRCILECDVINLPENSSKLHASKNVKDAYFIVRNEQHIRIRCVYVYVECRNATIDNKFYTWRGILVCICVAILWSIAR